MICNEDGSCSRCANTGSTIPHAGCDFYNPICSDGTECVCDPVTDPPITCESSSDEYSICSGYVQLYGAVYGGGLCVCGTTAGGGTHSECSGPLASCKGADFAPIVDPTTAKCQVMATHTQSFIY